VNAEAPALDLAECKSFLAFWREVTGASHVTLTAITPDGPTTTATFTTADNEKAGAWIAHAQATSRNVYFEVNETPARCAKKPTKDVMQAALCRHADVDPVDELYPYSEERDRLRRLAEFLHDDPLMPPTAILDSGNGIQPLWAIAREPLTAEIIDRVEAENRSIEAAVGAAGTHNIDRLLRLPGTLNFPNARKQKLGRGVSRARLLHSAAVAYSAAEAARLGKHLAERLAATDLVRKVEKATEPPPKATKDKSERAGQDRSRSAMRIGAALRRGGKSYEEMCAALRADPETADWCREKGDANGGRELHRIWDKASEADPIAALVAEFNAQFMVVREAGKAVIYAPAEDPILHRRYFDRLGFDDLRRLYLNRRIEVGRDDKDNPITRPVADVWLHHTERRQFIRGITFDPSGRPIPAGTLNLWQGFALKPRPGEWGLLKRHIFEIICGSCQDRFDYLMNWLARMAQYPAEQGEVAIVMRGGEGTGKGTLARAMMRILGQHGLAISNSKHLTGNFNAHLRDCVFLFADEAFYAGDPSHVGVLKSLITEPYLTIEAKYQNAVQMPNFVHLMMASNEEWVVPASLDARRFFVLEVSEAHANDHKWFGAIWQEMEAGGYEAMLHDLLHHDMTGFNMRHVPDTDGLQEQKKLSLGTSEAWWLDVLHRGYAFKSRLGLEDYFGEWHDEMATEVLFSSYSDHAKARNERHPMTREKFGQFMVSMGAKYAQPRNAVVGEHIADVAKNQYGDTTRQAELVKKARATGYHLGTLGAARAAFATKTKLAIAWAADDDTAD
jgi:hypothetical protein